MTAYYSIDQATGKWYAYTNSPACTRWGQTEVEARERLAKYVRATFDAEIIKWVKK